jgi:cell division septal protein FtsQ
MFEMINAAKAEPQDRKMLLVKIGATIAVLAALTGIVYFFAYLSYPAH